MDLNERNFRAIQAAINILETRFQNNSRELENVKVMLTQLTTQLTAVTQQVAILRATNLGRGPTVGN